MIGVILSLMATVTAFVLMVVALATPAWLMPGFGVFISCSESGFSNCTNSFGDDPESLAVAVLGTTSATFLVVGFVIFIVFFCQFKKDQGYTAAILYIFAAVLAIAGGSVFTGFYYDDAKNSSLKEFGYSFYLCWASALVSILAVIFTFIAAVRQGK